MENTCMTTEVQSKYERIDAHRELCRLLDVYKRQVEYHYGNGITHITNFGGDHQEDYVRVIGTKTWVDNGLQPEDREIVLLLLRTTNPSGADSWEPVPETEYILRWYNRDSDVWNYSFEGLPRRDADDNTLYTLSLIHIFRLNNQAKCRRKTT